MADLASKASIDAGVLIRRGTLGLLVLLLAGVKTMAQSPAPLTLIWQWGGTPAHRVIINVGSVKKAGGGWLGLGNSPSIAGNLPDTRIIEGVVYAGEGGGAVVLKIPNHELPPTKLGDLFAIGYTADNRAICVQHPPANLNPTQAAAWLNAWNCDPRP